MVTLTGPTLDPFNLATVVEGSDDVFAGIFALSAMSIDITSELWLLVDSEDGLRIHGGGSSRQVSRGRGGRRLPIGSGHLVRPAFGSADASAVFEDRQQQIIFYCRIRRVTRGLAPVVLGQRIFPATTVHQPRAHPLTPPEREKRHRREGETG
jgi:hypothetical protein